jgi:hypothetical protein
MIEPSVHPGALVKQRFNYAKVAILSISARLVPGGYQPTVAAG